MDILYLFNVVLMGFTYRPTISQNDEVLKLLPFFLKQKFIVGWLVSTEHLLPFIRAVSKHFMSSAKKPLISAIWSQFLSSMCFVGENMNAIEWDGVIVVRDEPMKERVARIVGDSAKDRILVPEVVSDPSKVDRSSTERIEVDRIGIYISKELLHDCLGVELTSDLCSVEHYSMLLDFYKALCVNRSVGKTILNGFKNFMLKGTGSWKRNLTLLFLIVHSIQKSEEEQRFYCEYLLKGPHSIWFIIMDSADDEKKLEVWVWRGCEG